MRKKKGKEGGKKGGEKKKREGGRDVGGSQSVFVTTRSVSLSTCYSTASCLKKVSSSVQKGGKGKKEEKRPG